MLKITSKPIKSVHVNVENNVTYIYGMLMSNIYIFFIINCASKSILKLYGPDSESAEQVHQEEAGLPLQTQVRELDCLLYQPGKDQNINFCFNR